MQAIASLPAIVICAGLQVTRRPKRLRSTCASFVHVPTDEPLQARW
jgi:hypothetical protein